jgi:hypothetical protein
MMSMFNGRIVRILGKLLEKKVIHPYKEVSDANNLAGHGGRNILEFGHAGTQGCVLYKWRISCVALYYVRRNFNLSLHPQCNSLITGEYFEIVGTVQGSILIALRYIEMGDNIGTPKPVPYLDISSNVPDLGLVNDVIDLTHRKANRHIFGLSS